MISCATRGFSGLFSYSSAMNCICAQMSRHALSVGINYSTAANVQQHKWQMETLTLSQCTLTGPVYIVIPLECHWLTQCTLGYHWVAQPIIARYTGTPLEKLNWNSPTLGCHWRNLVETAPHWDAIGQTLTLQPTLKYHWRECNGPHTYQAHIVKQSSIHVSLKWQDGGTPISKWTSLCKFIFYFELSALQWKPLLLLKHVSTSTWLCACLWYEHRYSFGVKWNQFSSNKYHHSSCIHKGFHAGKWPDLMTSKPDSVSTLEYHWTDYTGIPLEPQVHWDATGTILADASSQWCPSGDPVSLCLIGTHWKTTSTGATSTLGCHWNHTDWC